jgi:hypothetical protein
MQPPSLIVPITQKIVDKSMTMMATPVMAYIDARAMHAHPSGDFSYLFGLSQNGGAHPISQRRIVPAKPVIPLLQGEGIEKSEA